MAAVLGAHVAGLGALPVDLQSWHLGGYRLFFDIGEAEFKQFAEDDISALYEVRNHLSVRPFMPSPEPLSMAQHLAWVQAQLLSKHGARPLLFIGRQLGIPYGLGVLKPTDEKDLLEVGVMVVDTWQNSQVPGKLAVLLATIARQVFGASELLTYVNERHTQALRFNRGWGLIEISSDKPGEVCFRTPSALALSTSLAKRFARGIELRYEVEQQSNPSL